MHFKQETFSAVSPGEERQYVCFIQRNSVREMQCRSAAHERICTPPSQTRAEFDKAGISELLPFNLVRLLRASILSPFADFSGKRMCFYSYVMYSLRSHLLRPTVCASEAEGSEPVIAVLNFFAMNT